MPVIASIKIEGIEETVNALDKLPERFYEKVDNAMKTGIKMITNTAKAKCPYKTGTLRRSIKYGEGEEPLEYLCGTDVNYAEAVEYGTKPHTIFPKNKPFLAWKIYEYYWSEKYQKVKKGRYAYEYAKYVHHPGTTAQPFLEPALFEHEKEITEMVQAAMKEAIKEEGGEIE